MRRKAGLAAGAVLRRLGLCAFAALAVPGTAPADAPECARNVLAEVGEAADARAEIEESIGLPVTQNDLIPPDSLAIACHGRFCTEFSDVTRTPVWVVERLTPDIVTGENSRPSTSWSHDPKLEGNPNIEPVHDDAYRNSGWARGHMAASADFKCFEEWMKETFIFSNAVPQVQNGFNSGVWSGLEERIQNLAMKREEVFAITGPVHLPPDGAAIVIPEDENGCDREIVLPGKAELEKTEICDANDDDPATACEHGVAVPAGLYKIVYVPKSGRVFGFLIANQSHTDRQRRFRSVDDYLEEWRVSLNVIEELTGVKFFPKLDLRENRIAKEQCAVTRWR